MIVAGFIVAACVVYGVAAYCFAPTSPVHSIRGSMQITAVFNTGRRVELSAEPATTMLDLQQQIYYKTGTIPVDLPLHLVPCTS